ncbi:purine/cytosine permease [Nocardia terpenica]
MLLAGIQSLTEFSVVATVTAVTEYVDPNADRVGQIEQAGVEFLPEQARDSRPRNLAAVFIGGNLTWTVVVFGWLAISFGLDFADAASAIVVGALIGAVLVAPLAVVGPRTGTNMTVASGAWFGIRGRFVGSALALAFALAYGAVTVWTSGDALVAAAHRLIATPENDGVRALAYALVAAAMVTVALFGHGTIVAVQKVVVPVVGVLLLAGLVAFAGKFAPSATFGPYRLGGHWQTWTLSAVLAAGGPLSYAPVVGDYSRRISARRHRGRTIVAAFGIALFVGQLPALLGAYIATGFTTRTGSFLHDVVAAAPAWYLLPILVISLAGGLGQGVMNIYASGLDLEGLLPRLRRVQTTTISAAVSIVLLYVGVFVVNAADAVTAMTVVLNAVAAPWIVVLVGGVLRQRGDGFDTVDLQAFAQGRRGGRYWFTRGWNVPATAAWAAGSIFGILTVDTTLYTGPLAGIAGGIDVSTLGSALVTAVTYPIALRLSGAPRRAAARHEETAALAAKTE